VGCKGVDHERCEVVLKTGCVIDAKICMSQRTIMKTVVAREKKKKGLFIMKTMLLRKKNALA